MKARIKWVEDVMFVGESGSGHTMVIDGPPDFGGRNLGMRPMELLLQGLGGCTAFDVMLILKRGRHFGVAEDQVRVGAVCVGVERDRVDLAPRLANKADNVEHILDPVAVGVVVIGGGIVPGRDGANDHLVSCVTR